MFPSDAFISRKRISGAENAEEDEKKLRGDEKVYTSAFGRDYCESCRAYLQRGDLRETTAAERIKEDVVPAGGAAGSSSDAK